MTVQQPWQPAARPSTSGPAAAGDARTSVWFACSIVAVAWSLVAFIGGVLALAYLGLGAVMTHSLDGVFGSEPEYLFNWAVLWTAVIGQAAGLVASLLVALLALRDRRRGRRLATPGVVLGFVATGVFLILGLVQIPLVSLLFDALAL